MWSLDSARLPDQASGPSFIGYIAFSSEVQHEVLPVTSGSRVTLTYNLHFNKSLPLPLITPLSDNPDPTHPPVKRLYDAFGKILEDPRFLPNGGYLAFRLAHQYPLRPYNRALPQNSLEYRKASDATILSVAQKLGLDATLKIAYEGGMDKSQLFTDRFIDMHAECIDYVICLVPQIKQSGDMIAKPLTNKPEVVVLCETKKERRHSSVKEPFAAYGSEATLCYLYGDYCLLIRVGPAGERASAV